MPRVHTVHRCTDCGTGAPRWSGRCGGCGAWNTMIEEVDDRRPPPSPVVAVAAEPAVPICEVDAAEWAARSTGIGELDRVLGGGLVPGSVTLVGGEPGIGKSTLLLEAMASMARAGAKCLLVSAEESRQQVRLRAERLGALEPRLWLLAETSLPAVAAAVDDVAPDICVVDSIQTVTDPELASPPGSVGQVRQCAHRLVQLAKAQAMATVLVGHVTKDGSLAGPRVLEHVVDTVLSFEGERHHALRLLRAVKHRFGSTGELGLFEMTDAGLEGVPDPSGLFLGDRRLGVPGSVVAPLLEGRRPLLVEIQALVAPSTLGTPRRSAQGLDGGRLALLATVLQRRLRLQLADADIYASVVGGARVNEPAADLAVAMAIASGLTGLAIPPHVVACGEVGLAGEVRNVAQVGRRLAEAARLGFRTAVVAASAPEPPAGMKLVRVATLADALHRLGILAARDAS